MAQALLPIQRNDGFWNCSLADPNDFGGKETSGTALFTYALAWGINMGILDSVTYKPIVVKAWNAMVNDALHPNGMLGYVQGTGKQPSEGQPTGYDKTPDFEDYGLGTFLLAGSEVYKLAKDSTSNTGIQNLPELHNFCLYPNPFHSVTTISYDLSKSCSVNAYVLDVTGKKVYTILQNEKQCSGNYKYCWNGKDTLGNSLPIGVYVAFVQTDAFIQTRKVEIIR